MRARVTKVFRFEAAHSLPNHDGKCRNPHGHSYKVEVCCDGNIIEIKDHAKEGMVVDFADIKKVWKEVIEPWVDHQDLNITLGERMGVPTTTAENIATWMIRVFAKFKIPISSVTIWETETSSATVQYTEAWANGYEPIDFEETETIPRY